MAKEKTDHQQIGHIYRTMIHAAKKERNQIKYIRKKKTISDNMKKKLYKTQGKYTALTGIIATIERDFGLRLRDGETYNQTLKRTRE